MFKNLCIKIKNKSDDMKKKIFVFALFLMLCATVFATGTAPVGLAASATKTGRMDKITVSWTAKDVNTTCFTNYEVQRQNGPTASFTEWKTSTDVNSVSFVDKSIVIGGMYSYKVRWTGGTSGTCGSAASGTSAWSTPVTATVADAAVGGITNEVINLVYTVFAVFANLMPLIIIIGVAAGAVLLISAIIKGSKGIGS
jgi:hypothetical protein